MIGSVSPALHGWFVVLTMNSLPPGAGAADGGSCGKALHGEADVRMALVAGYSKFF